jgi:hypothetical protein
MHGMHGGIAIWLFGMGLQGDDSRIDGVEQRCIDELWRRMWRRIYAERGKLVEEARSGDVGRRRTERGERSEVERTAYGFWFFWRG